MDDELIPFETRRNLLLAAWIIAALATVYVISIPLLVFFIFFPSGLFYMIYGEEASGPQMLAGWLVYLVITWGALATKRWFMFVIFYGTLVVMLVYNVQGCHRILSHIE
jgi:hypothetical protein